MDDRIRVSKHQLAAAIAGWLRAVPKRVWEQLAEHRILSLYKRPGDAPRLERELAEHIAGEMARVIAKVTHPAPEQPASPPAY